MEVQDGRVSRLHCILHPDKATSPEAGEPTVAGGKCQQIHRCLSVRGSVLACLTSNRLNMKAATFEV